MFRACVCLSVCVWMSLTSGLLGRSSRSSFPPVGCFMQNTETKERERQKKRGWERKRGRQQSGTDRVCCLRRKWYAAQAGLLLPLSRSSQLICLLFTHGSLWRTEARYRGSISTRNARTSGRANTVLTMASVRMVGKVTARLLGSIHPLHCSALKTTRPVTFLHQVTINLMRRGFVLIWSVH